MTEPTNATPLTLPADLLDEVSGGFDWSEANDRASQSAGVAGLGLGLYGVYRLGMKPRLPGAIAAIGTMVGLSFGGAIGLAGGYAAGFSSYAKEQVTHRLAEVALGRR